MNQSYPHVFIEIAEHGRSPHTLRESQINPSGWPLDVAGLLLELWVPDAIERFGPEAEVRLMRSRTQQSENELIGTFTLGELMPQAEPSGGDPIRQSHYFVHVEGCVEPTIHGPFDCESERDEAARELHEEEDVTFRLDIIDGVPSVEAYSYDELPNEDDAD